MPEKENNRSVSQKLVAALVQFRRLKGFPPNGEAKGNGEKKWRHSEIMILFALKGLEASHPQGVSISELSRFLRVKPPTVTPAVFALETGGLVERSADPKDRRVTHIRLTPEGIRFIKSRQKLFIARIEGVVNFLGEEKSNQLADLLNEVYDYASGLSEKKQ